MTEIASGSIDLKSLKEAGTKASKYISTDTSGIMIYDGENGIQYPLTVLSTTNNVFIDDNSVDIRKGTTTLASFGTETVIKTTNGTELAHFGYASGQSESGTDVNPYYTLGVRTANSTVGNYSTAEGYDNIASGYASHADGHRVVAQGAFSHAETLYAEAQAKASHAEGYSYASGMWSHSENGPYGEIPITGRRTEAMGLSSHAEGCVTKAKGDYSHSQNLYTIAGSKSQTALGRYNIEDNVDTYAVIIGNGTSTSARSNAMTVDWNGNIIAQGMAGQIIMYAGSTAPTGWLFCQGQSVSRTTYATLFAVIGTTYGAGDGSTTFNLPDFRGRVGVGVGTGTAAHATTHTLNQIEGDEDAIVPYHRHASYKYTSSALGSGSVGARIYNPTGSSGDSTMYTSYAGTSGNATGANMPPYIGINYIICTGKTN